MGVSNAVSQTTFLAGLITALAAAGAYLYHRLKSERIPTNWQEVGKVKKINLYPLKSGHRIELKRAECKITGLSQTEQDEKVFPLRDRALVVYNEKDNEFRTARTYPKMVLIDVSVHDVDHLAIDAPTMRTLYVKIPNKKDSKETTITLHEKEKISTTDCGDEAASWFSRYILEKDSGLRLGYHDGSYKRDITKAHKNIIQYYIHLGNHSTGLYSDLTSVLLVNQASVDDLNKKIGKSSVSVENFRPNIIVDGPKLEPYAEDDWDWIKIGDVVFRNVKDCTRCIITTINPDTGMRSMDREPLKTLETYRMSPGPEKGPVMGINLRTLNQGSIGVGDAVHVVKMQK